ncbi:hypothetical protein RPYSC3_25560 [Rhodopseudomonas palustris]|nr:hypothetical protein RPYSC3_25560 [Rhodopseudomonas palustris]
MQLQTHGAASEPSRKKLLIYSVIWSPDKPQTYRLVAKCRAGEIIENFDNWGSALTRALELERLQDD